jgi:plasmid stabilization system protein ParE
MTARSNPTQAERRLDRLEAAVASLARLETRLANIPPGVYPELDAIRAERAGGPGLETRPHLAHETRERTAVA